MIIKTKPNYLSVKKLLNTILIISVLSLSACNSETSDLEQYFSEQRSRSTTAITPIPEVKPYLRYVYPKHEKDPFDASMLAPSTTAVEPVINNGINIDTTRVPEFLEGFPLDSLRMVGTVEKDKILWALVKIPEGAVQTVKLGNYLGQNYGKVVNISDVRVSMLETVPNNLGGYEEREISIALSQE